MFIRKRNIWSKFQKFANYSGNWFINPARFLKRVSPPRSLNIPVTDNCNARCVMCDVWKTRSENELSVEQWKNVLSNQLFTKVKHVGLSGGEPTLRHDLIELIAIITSVLPSLESLSITSHGFHHKKWQKLLPEITSLCDLANVDLRLNFSLDGINQVHDIVRGIPNAHKRTEKSIALAVSSNVNVQIQCTVSTANVHNMPSMLHAMQQQDTDVIFRLATIVPRLSNEHVIPQVALNDEEKSYFADFLTSSKLLSSTQNPSRRLFYRDLGRRLSGNQKIRNAPCYYQREALLLTAHGDMYHCSISTEKIGNVIETSAEELYFSEKSVAIRNNLINSVCPSCVHDQSGAWNPILLIFETFRMSNIGKFSLKFFEGLIWLLRAILALSINYAVNLKPNDNQIDNKAMKKSNSAIVIGAYGGEHVGDAAILGGVLLRLKEKYSVTSAIIASSRPDRTQRWVNELNLPVNIQVVDYSISNIKDEMIRADILVYGGGPIMDLPRSLTRHLETFNIARRFNKFILMEGVGVGPLNNIFYRLLARRLFFTADDINIRTKHSAKSPILNNLPRSNGQDPAFDYLATRGKHLTLLDSRFKQIIDSLTVKHANSVKVAVNLRPMWHKYITSGKSAIDIEDNIMNELASALDMISTDLDDNLVIFLFPMNADQYGFSDVSISYRLADKLKGLRFEIVEYELGVDDVVYFLRQMDAVIAMRFHGCIFALSQNKANVIGIDYMSGGIGKVTELFEDINLSSNLHKIDTLNSHELHKTLMSILAEPAHSL